MANSEYLENFIKENNAICSSDLEGVLTKQIKANAHLLENIKSCVNILPSYIGFWLEQTQGDTEKVRQMAMFWADGFYRLICGYFEAEFDLRNIKTTQYELDIKLKEKYNQPIER